MEMNAGNVEQRKIFPVKPSFVDKKKRMRKADLASHPRKKYIEDITRWREDMNFMFEWQELYLTSERSERVRYCSCTREHNIHIFEPTCNVLFIIWRLNIKHKTKA